MAETTTAVNACDVKIHVDNSSGVPVDISGSSNRASLELRQTVESYRVFGQRWMKRKTCAKEGTVQLDVVYSEAADEGLDILRDWWFSNDSGTPRTVRLMVPSDAVGDDDYMGEFVLENLSIPIDAGQTGPIIVSATLLSEGAITYAALAT